MLEAKPADRIWAAFLDSSTSSSDWRNRVESTWEYEHSLNAYHSESFNTFLNSLPVIGVIETRPPLMVVVKLELSLVYRVILAALMLEYLNGLNSFESKLDSRHTAYTVLWLALSASPTELIIFL